MSGRRTYTLDEAGTVEGAVPLPERYVDLGRLGMGGMGEVRLVEDTVLGRDLAMKIARGQLSAASRERFLAEARATAQLVHPAIIAVHDLGELPDGRPYFTMQLVRGSSLEAAILAHHAGSGLPLRRLVEDFSRVCGAVAYAHERGVLHRDLKPANVMLGQFGEVLVLDWGLVQVGAPEPGEDGVWTGTGRTTKVGAVSGTPAYMAPEQARADHDAIGPATDVFGLGATLYEIATGRAPYEAEGGEDPLALAVRAEWTDPEELGADHGLATLCRQAMARRATDRPSAASLAQRVTDWLDGVARKEESEAHIARARSLAREADHLRKRAEEARREAARALDGVEPWQPEAEKAEGWAALDRARDLEHDAIARAAEAEAMVQTALTIDPQSTEGHVELALRWKERHARAEADGDHETAIRAEIPLRHHVLAVSPDHPRIAELEGYLAGTGALTLVTSPPGEAELLRYDTRKRRWEPEPVRSLGRTPLVDVELPVGSYLVVVRAEGFAPLRYPVKVGRLEHWDGRPPGEAEPLPVRLLRTDELGEDEVYVPPGWFAFGGDPGAPGSLPAGRAWCDGFAIQRFAVTNRAWLEMLDDLVDRGRTEDALRAVPRERAGAPGELGALLYGFDGRHFELREGRDWGPDAAVSMVDVPCVAIHAMWMAERTGLPWRMLGDLEWEKAARGVDGRRFPWGDHYDASWACNRYSREDLSGAPPVDRGFETDESPYGARGLAGNARTFCANRPELEDLLDADRVRFRSVEEMRGSPPDLVCVRGGTWMGPASMARSANRVSGPPFGRDWWIGARLGRSIAH